MLKKVLLCGVGGQGILLAAKVIASAAEVSGYAVCTNEIHGMAQRGGSVTAQVKFGEEVNSPLILEGTADVIGALEQIEALRYAHYLKPEGFAAVSLLRIIPVTVSIGAASYPNDVEERLRKVYRNLVTCDCAGKALGLGDVRLSNTVLLGILSRCLGLQDEAWQEALKRQIKPAFLELNRLAFAYGKEYSA